MLYCHTVRLCFALFHLCLSSIFAMTESKRPCASVKFYFILKKTAPANSGHALRNSRERFHELNTSLRAVFTLQVWLLVDWKTNVVQNDCRPSEQMKASWQCHEMILEECRRTSDEFVAMTGVFWRFCQKFWVRNCYEKSGNKMCASLVYGRLKSVTDRMIVVNWKNN